MPNKETEYEVLGALYNKPVERRRTDIAMNISELGAETGLDYDTLTSALLSLELKNWVKLVKIPDGKIALAKITPKGRLEYEGRRFRRPEW